MECFSIQTGADGIAEVLLDVPGRTMNTITPEVMAELGPLVERIAGDDAIKGVVLASGKANGFCAGADLGHQAQNAGQSKGEAEQREALERAYRLNALLRRLETCGKPVAVALEGLALGGGLEIALACHYRVAARSPRLQLGLPEANVGLLPGGGGTQRLPRLIGIAKALPLLLEGKPLRAEEAHRLGLVHALAEPGETIAAARAWLATTPEPLQPWDRKGYQLPGGGPYGAGGPAIIAGSATVKKRSFGNYPAQENILRCVYEGVQVPIEAGLRIESRYFLKTRQTPQAKAMIRTQFQSIQALRKGALRPAGFPKWETKKAAVLGAGMMGAGIAFVQAAAGIETVLLDVSEDAATKGKAHSEKVVEKAVARGQMTREAGDALLARITASADYSLIEGADLVVEAVFENRELKAEVTKKAEALLKPGAVLASNTSTLPITGLAEASVRPDSFIGLHFFSPVDRMDLVEVICGQKTSPETLAKGLDYIDRIRKTPIVVNDARGFYTSRCFGTYSAEGMEMFAEGIAPAIIDNVGRMTGMPRGPLELVDDVAIDLVYKVRKQTREDLGDAYKPEARDAIVTRMVEDFGRFGRKNGKGFYDYPEGGPKTLWTGLSDIAPVRIARPSPELIEEIRTRLLYRQALEAARCMEEGVVSDPRSVDVGAVLGWGFARWTGGPASLIDMVGVAEFVARCDALAQKYGARFAPPAFLREIAARGGSLYEAEATTVAEAA
ncbi:MAG: 3-hydroxyacyl-CoA dehydrogenase NAD-binding domain-containing protein [Novosphingobium sp.]